MFTSCSIIKNNRMLTVFLLSGTDRKMHLFMESKDNEVRLHSYIILIMFEHFLLVP